MCQRFVDYQGVEHLTRCGLPCFAESVVEPGTDFTGEESLTKQEFAEECDINRIMARYDKTGELPPDVRVGAYGDFSTSLDFHAAQNVLKNAEAQFASLAADVRAEFGNDPARFLDFVHDPKNADRARELGMLDPVPEVPVVKFAPGEVIKVETLDGKPAEVPAGGKS